MFDLHQAINTNKVTYPLHTTRSDGEGSAILPTKLRRIEDFQCAIEKMRVVVACAEIDPHGGGLKFKAQ